MRRHSEKITGSMFEWRGMQSVQKYAVNYNRILPEVGNKAFRSHLCFLHVNLQ